MEENWYAVEQQVRDRLAEARAAARIRALTQKAAPTARRRNGIAMIRLANWTSACAMQLALELSRGFASVRAAMKNTASHRRNSSNVADGNT
jgi:hypothetical protein